MRCPCKRLHSGQICTNRLGTHSNGTTQITKICKRCFDNRHVGALGHIPRDWWEPRFPWWLYIQLVAGCPLGTTSTRRQETQGIKLEHVPESRLHKSCQHHSQKQGAAQPVTLHTSQHTDRSLPCHRGPLRTGWSGKALGDKRGLFALIRVLLPYYLISYRQTNNSHVLFLFQFI